MATKFDNLLQPSNSTDALFRAWCVFVHELFTVTGVWVNTADTGQVDLATVTRPLATDTKQGYKIYRMADALQATAPIFMRLDFGSSQFSLNGPGIWLTIGTGSNGAGTITGIILNGGAVAQATIQNSSNSATASNSYGSAATGRVHCMLFVQAGASRTLLFSIERSKNSSGADTADGLIVIYIDSNAALNASRYLVMSGSQPPKEEGLHYVLSGANPSGFGSDIGIGIPIPIKGVAQLPGTGVIVTRTNDFVVEATLNMTLYGSARTYQLANLLFVAIPPSSQSQSTTRAGIRFD